MVVFFCHLEVEFDLLLQSVERKILNLFEIQRLSEYRAVVITGSGTAANESILSSVVGDKSILILSNGEFGERLFNTSKIYNKNTFLLQFAWGERFDFKIIQSYLENNDIDIVAMVHHETSSGMLNCLEKVGALSKAHGAMFIVDCVSSAGAEAIDMEKCHIAFCSSSSAKAIASYAGLSFVVGKTKEFEKLKDLPINIGYLNLYKFYYFMKTVSQTPNTPAVHLLYALEQALTNILKSGTSNHFAFLKEKADFLRKGMLELGLTFLIDQTDMSSVLTTVNCPSYVNMGAFRKKLREKSIIIYEGKGCYKDKVFQVGNIGELSFDNLQFFLDALKTVLQEFKQVEVNRSSIIKANTPQLTPMKVPLKRESLSAVSRA